MRVVNDARPTERDERQAELDAQERRQRDRDKSAEDRAAFVERERANEARSRESRED